MKNLIFLVLMAVGITAVAQNMVGESQYTVILEQQNSGHIVDAGEDYVFVQEPDMTKYYYFVDNRCMVYILCLVGYDYSDLMGVMRAKEEVYEVHNGYFYSYDGRYSAQVKYSQDIGEWVLIFTLIE